MFSVILVLSLIQASQGFQCVAFCANQPENCYTMHLWCGGCPVCRRLAEKDAATQQNDAAAENSRQLSQCAGFCANQPANCSTMSLWCGGCPVCRRLKAEKDAVEA